MPNNNNLDNIELRSEEVQEILTKVPHWMIRWGNLLFLSLILLLLFITWFVKYPDVISSEATVTTEVPPQKEYAQISGKIQAILVEDNQNVIPNQPLAILENTANYKDVFKLKSIIDTLQINSKSFYFPIDSLPVLFLGDIESQYALFENSYYQYKLNNELQPFSNEAIANQYSTSELNRRLRSLQLQKNISEKDLELSKTRLNRQKLLHDKGVIPTQDYENEQLLYVQKEVNFKNYESSISQIREGLSNARRTTKGNEINKIREEKILIKSVFQSLNQLKKAIKDWERIYTFTSNIKGKISFLNFWDVNQNVNQNDLVFTIIPTENSSFIARLKTPAQNSGKLKIGQTVNIKLENYPDVEFGVLSGTVKRISSIPDKDGLYFLDVDLPKKLITSYKKEIEFKQEMRGSAEIITEDLRLIERFFYQFKQILDR